MRDVIQLTREMVAFDTTSSNSNLELACFLRVLFERMGFSVEFQKKTFPAEKQEQETEREKRLSEREKSLWLILKDLLGGFGFVREIHRKTSGEVTKTNLIARIGPEGVEPFMFSGHMDVMPVGNLIEWKVGKGGSEKNLNPLQITEYDGKLYGRGSVDMKGPIAATICAVEPLVDLAGKFKRELIFGLTYDEEVGLRGARRMVEEEVVKPRFTLIAEPTQLIPMRMHKGHLCLTAFCRGKKAHAADPSKGRNAIELAALVIIELEKFSEELKGVKQPLIDPPHTTLNVALTAGGSKLNEVPDGCLVSFAIRPIPGQSVQRIKEYITDRLTSIGGCDKSGNPLVVVDLFEKARQPTDPMIAPPDSELVLVTEAVSKEASRGACYSTDASMLQHLGTDCVIFGPGCIDTAHKPNEYIEIEQLQNGVEQFRKIARRMCL